MLDRGWDQKSKILWKSHCMLNNSANDLQWWWWWSVVEGLSVVCMLLASFEIYKAFCCCLPLDCWGGQTIVRPSLVGWLARSLFDHAMWIFWHLLGRKEVQNMWYWLFTALAAEKVSGCVTASATCPPSYLVLLRFWILVPFGFLFGFGQNSRFQFS